MKQDGNIVASRHLDLRCGDTPRNPYHRDLLLGVDLFARHGDGLNGARHPSLGLGAIPYEDSYFDSVSAYDVLEHVPRILPTLDQQSVRFPFIELMNEVWRVLKPGGLFYASTPVYPAAQAFGDPTHVNVLTRNTHRYFTRPMLFASRYGFAGDFTALRVRTVRPGPEFYPLERTFGRRVLDRIQREFPSLESRRRTHILWEFTANKSDGTTIPQASAESKLNGNRHPAAD